MPRLVAILLQFPDKEALGDVCLQALCNISGMGLAEEAGRVWERGASVRPGESVFHGVSPHTCGFDSSVTLVRVSQWGPGQYAVSIEVFQRCSSSFWNLHGNKRTAHWSPFSSFGSCSNLYKLLKFSTRNIPRTKSLKTRVFHTFLWNLEIHKCLWALPVYFNQNFLISSSCLHLLCKVQSRNYLFMCIIRNANFCNYMRHDTD